jgi:UDP-glucose 4-epimerase
MRVLGIRRIAFASSSAVYGEHSQLPTPEDCTWPIQTSLYGASKVAGEALVAAYCAGQKFEGYIFRFSPVVGERYTHGHIFDFVRALLDNPNRLVVRGNGKQRKPYVYVGDVVQAMTWIMGHHWDAYPAIYNVTNVDAVAVSQNVEWIASEMGLKPTVHYGTEDKGWTGDMPVLWPSSEKLRRTGWAPLVSTEEGVRRTVRWLLSNRWALEGRE